MKQILVTVTCEAGHSQPLKLDSSFGEDYARSFAGLLDGSSPMYKFPPGPESVIGKCGICGKRVKATVGVSDEEHR